MESVIIDVVVKTADAIKGIEDLEKNILSLKQRQEELNKKYKDGDVALVDYVKETKILNTELTREEKALKTVTGAVNAQEGSINALTQEIKDLIKERNNLNTTTQEGAQRILEINRKIDENNLRIKANSSQLEQQRLNIGNYASALQGLGGKVGPALGSVNGLVSSFQALGNLKMGGVIGLIVVAVEGAIKYFQKFSDVIEYFEDIWTQLTGGIGAFIDNIGMLFTDFNGLIDKITSAASEAQRLLDVEREIEAKALSNAIAKSKNAPILAKLFQQLKDENLAYEKKLEIIEKIKAIQLDEASAGFETAQEKFINEFLKILQKYETQVKKFDKDFEQIADKVRKTLPIDKAIGPEGTLKIFEAQFEFLQKKGILSEEAFKDAFKAYDDLNQIKASDVQLTEKLNQLTTEADLKEQERLNKQITKQQEVSDKRNKIISDFYSQSIKTQVDSIEKIEVIDRESFERFKSNEVKRYGILINAELERFKLIKNNNKIDSFERTKQLTESNNLIKELINQRNIAIKQGEDQLKKIEEDTEKTYAKIAENDATFQAKRLENIKVVDEESFNRFKEIEEQKLKYLILAEETKRDIEIKNAGEIAAQKELIKQQSDQRIIELEKSKNDAILKEDEKLKNTQATNEKALFDLKVKLFGDLANELAKISEEGTIRAKVAALTQIAIDTGLAISALTKNSEANTANAATFGGAAVIQFATGLIRIFGNMKKAKDIIGFASGGYTGPGGKYEPAGIVHKPTFRGYADGGIVTSAITNPINQSFSIANAYKNLPPIYASWKEATEIQNRVQFKQSLTTLGG